MRVMPVRFRIIFVGRANRRNDGTASRRKEKKRGQNFVPRLVIIAGANMRRREGPRGLLVDDNSDLNEDFPSP